MMRKPKFNPLIDGDHERFGPTRAQVTAWAAGQDKVELTFDREFILTPVDCDDFAHWLTAVLKPSIENINASVEEDAGYDD